MIGLNLSEIAHYYLHHAKILSARCDTVFHIWWAAIDGCVRAIVLNGVSYSDNGPQVCDRRPRN